MVKNTTSKKKVNPPLSDYSYLKASIGLLREAWRAG